MKTYMPDTTLQQAPVLVLPSAREEQLVDEPREVCASHPLSNQKIQEWTKLEVKLRDYGTRKAVGALHTLVHDRSFVLARTTMAPIWLDSGSG